MHQYVVTVACIVTVCIQGMGESPRLFGFRSTLDYWHEKYANCPDEGSCQTERDFHYDTITHVKDMLNIPNSNNCHLTRPIDAHAKILDIAIDDETNPGECNATTLCITRLIHEILLVFCFSIGSYCCCLCLVKN